MSAGRHALRVHELPAASPERLARVRVQPRPVPAVALFAAAITAGVGIVHVIGGAFHIYGVALGSLLTAKLALALVPPRRHPDRSPGLVVGVTVPVFNEDPAALLACLESLDGQTSPPALVVIIDDGSTDPRAIDTARVWAENRDPHTRGPVVRFIRQPQNRGKRQAMAAAWLANSGAVDVWCSVDSDTVLHRDAVREGIRPFHDDQVQAVTGTVLALNRGNALSSLIGLRYLNAFLGERAAYSRLGAVLCCCGSLSFYRSRLLAENVADFLSQEFAGSPAVAGDDRRLTRYALDAGRVELARDSIAFTLVPERVGHMVRQQVRWGRSFWRESWLMLRDVQPRRVAWWLTLVEVVTSLAFGSSLLLALLLAPLVGDPRTAFAYLGWVAVTSWARSVHVLTVRGHGHPARSVATFLAAPAYGLLSLLVLLPLRVWSLATVRARQWGTRTTGAEVGLAVAR